MKPTLIRRWGIPGFAAVLFVACTPVTRHKVLSILLDGVPPLVEKKPPPKKTDTVVRSTETVRSAPVRAKAPTTTMFSDNIKTGDIFHPPFKQKLCLFCHSNGLGKDRLRFPLPTICFQCHGRLDQMGETVHWPVRQGRCTTCHNPHQAGVKKLLCMPVPRLCFRCHNVDLLSKEKHARDVNLCLDCHNPHSAAKRRLLIK